MSEAGSETALRPYGRRMRGVRERAGLSLREAAARAGVDKNTVVRLEAGLPVREASRQKICAAYGVFCRDPEDLDGRVEGEGFAVLPADARRWHRARVPGPDGPSVVTTFEEFANPAERMRQGRLGLANQFFALLGCDLPAGRLRAAVFEVYAPSGYSRQTSGEAFVFAMRGRIRFVVGEGEFTLEEGSAAIFDRTLLHMHEPASTGSPEDLPVVLLYVQCD